jgi:hypothetical protein
MRFNSLALFTALLIAHAAAAAEDGTCDNDYPTAARADYVFACMAANGETLEVLHKCSCSIDVIASILSYEEYEKADTVLRAQLDIGQRGIFYRESAWAKEVVDKLRTAQAESTLRCF